MMIIIEKMMETIEMNLPNMIILLYSIMIKVQ